MTALTPLDIENAVFRTVMRGYDRADVESFRSAVLQAVGDYVQLIGQYRSRIGELESQLRHYKDSEELLKNSVLLAQKTGEDLAHSARQQAEAIVGQARLEAERVRAGIADLEAQRERFEFEFYGLLAGFMGRLEQHNPELGRLQGYSRPGPAAPAAHAEPLLAELQTAQSPAPLPAQSPARPAPVPQVAKPALPAAEAHKRDLDIDDFSAALDSARPRSGSAWESVEPDLDEAEADPYGADEEEWLEEDLAADGLALSEAVTTAIGDDPAVYEDEALSEEGAPFEDDSVEDADEEAPLLDEEEDDDDEYADDDGDFDSEFLDTEALELDEDAPAAETPAGDAPRATGLIVHPVDDDDDDDDAGPRVRRTSRW